MLARVRKQARPSWRLLRCRQTPGSWLLRLAVVDSGQAFPRTWRRRERRARTGAALCQRQTDPVDHGGDSIPHSLGCRFPAAPPAIAGMPVQRPRSLRAFFGRFPAILRTAAAIQSVVERASRQSWDRLLGDRALRMRLSTVASTASLPRCRSACSTVALASIADR